MSHAGALASEAGEGLLARTLRVPPAVWVFAGFGVFCVLFAIFALLPEGDVPGAEDPRGLRIPAYFAVTIGFYLAAVPLTVRSAVASMEGSTAVDASARERFCRELVRLPATWIAFAVAAGFCFHLTMLSIVGVPTVLYLPFGHLGTRVGFASLLGWVQIFFFTLGVAVFLRQGILFARLGRELAEVDLLDHRRVAPFVRAALRLPLLLVLAFAIGVMLHVDWGGDGTIARQVVLVSPIMLLVMVALFLLPIWGVHQRLAAERTAELARVNRAIRGDRAALRASLVAADADRLHAVDLLQYREQVRGFSTWPFDAGNLVQLLLYTGIPLLGWIGSAFVERGLGLLLD